MPFFIVDVVSLLSSMVKLPLLGSKKPSKISNNELLPEPVLPIIIFLLPLKIDKFTFLIIFFCVCLYLKVTLFKLIFHLSFKT